MIRRPGPALLVLGAAALAITLAGCTAPAPAPTVTRTVTETPSPSPTPSPTRTADDSDAPAGQCADADLVITVTKAAGGGSAGSSHYDVGFENVGTASCELAGYPGVSLVDAQSVQIGAAAVFTGGKPVTRTLAPKGSVFVPVQVASQGALPDCGPVQAEGWSIYAPHSTYRSVNLNGGTIPACASGVVFLQVTAPVAPGVGS